MKFFAALCLSLYGCLSIAFSQNEITFKEFITSKIQGNKSQTMYIVELQGIGDCIKCRLATKNLKSRISSNSMKSTSNKVQIIAGIKTPRKKDALKFFKEADLYDSYIHIPPADLEKIIDIDNIRFLILNEDYETVCSIDNDDYAKSNYTQKIVDCVK
jgi:hypothetical protein